MYWKSKKVSNSPHGFFLRLSCTKVWCTILFLVGFYFSLYIKTENSATEKDFQVGFSVYAPSFEFNPGYCLKMMSITLFYNDSIFPVFQFLLQWKNQKNLSSGRHMQPQAHSTCTQGSHTNTLNWFHWKFGCYFVFIPSTTKCATQNLSFWYVPESSSSLCLIP